MGEPAFDLVALGTALSDGLDEVSLSDDVGTVTYARGGTTFARASASLLEVRLPVDIAEAALRTSDTSAGDGPGWVRFEPRDAERHVIDRAEAWFQTAWRHAADTSGGRT